MDADELRRAAMRMLADYDAARPNQIFAERGTDWLTLDDAYAVQRAVAKLRMARGERCLGYKVGCTSPAIQEQFGLRQPVRGYVWESEAHISGCRLSPSRFANLAIEGEIALRLRHDITTETASDADVWDCVECWFPVIELHNYVFRGTNTELPGTGRGKRNARGLRVCIFVHLSRRYLARASRRTFRCVTQRGRERGSQIAEAAVDDEGTPLSTRLSFDGGLADVPLPSLH